MWVLTRSHRLFLRPFFNHPLTWQIKAHGWTNPEPFSATAEVIVPLVAGLIGMLVLPPTVIVVLRHVIPVQFDQRFIRKFFAAPISPLVALIACL
jgi:hypothetical protein